MDKFFWFLLANAFSNHLDETFRSNCSFFYNQSSLECLSFSKTSLIKWATIEIVPDCLKDLQVVGLLVELYKFISYIQFLSCITNHFFSLLLLNTFGKHLDRFISINYPWVYHFYLVITKEKRVQRLRYCEIQTYLLFQGQISPYVSKPGNRNVPELIWNRLYHFYKVIS